ncbi:MAG: dephospho-CoA kinase, partial [Xanthomonadales bacterium]|nr:dephospho-CoA kinase [Xanthomonadales bacterium]
VDRQTQLSRLLQRDGIDLELASAMIAAQASREQRLAIADDILTNEGTLADLSAAVAALDRKYRDCAQASD